MQFLFKDRNKYPIAGYEHLPVRILDPSLDKPLVSAMESSV